MVHNKMYFPCCSSADPGTRSSLQMRKMRLDRGKASPNIYIVLRVYNLTSDNIGMRMLVDPATMERNGLLVFEAENYTVLQQDALDQDAD